MKSVNKELFIFGLLLCFSSIASAQTIRDISPKIKDPVFIPQIKYEDNKLFVTHFGGVFYQDYSSGNLPVSWGREGHEWEMYGFAGMRINNFVINGNKMLAATDNYYPGMGGLFVKSEDGGKTYTKFTPEIFSYIYNLYIGDPFRIENLVQNPHNKDELLAILANNVCLKSYDFGETWEYYLEFAMPKIISYHPTNPNVMIVGGTGWLDIWPQDYYDITTDGGKTFESIYSQEDIFSSQFVVAESVAYHATNDNIIIVGGTPIMASFDCGKTWQTQKAFDADNVEFFTGLNFDSRGSDRLYANILGKFVYSDDFGVTWTNLCELPEAIFGYAQINNKFICYAESYKIYEVDLSLCETAVEEIDEVDFSVNFSVVGDNLILNTALEINKIDIYNLVGIRELSYETRDKSIDISKLGSGTHIICITCESGEMLTMKFNR